GPNALSPSQSFDTSGPSFASSIYDSPELGGADYWAQVFTAQTSGALTQVDFGVDNRLGCDSTQFLQLDIYSATDAFSAPGNQLLAQSDLVDACSLQSFIGSQYPFTFAAPALIEAGKSY